MYFDKPPVLEKVIPEIMVSYPFGEVLECEYLGGVPNVTYKVVTKQRTLAVRISNNGYTSTDHLNTEIKLLEHLANTGFAESPRPVIGSNGEVLQRWKGYRVFATEYINGTPGEKVEITPNLCHDVGRILASLQKALSSFEGKVPRGESFIERGVRLLDLLPNTSRMMGWELDTSKILGQWDRANASFAQLNDKVVISIIHSDIWPPNVICKEETVVGVVDFDDWCYGASIIELCASLVDFPMFNTVTMNAELAIALLSGYFKYGGIISDIEKNLIVDGMEMVCASWLACNALHSVDFKESEFYLKKLNLLRNDKFRKRLNRDIYQFIDMAFAKGK